MNTVASEKAHLYSLSLSIHIALNTDNILLKIQIFLVLSAISKHSREGLDATLEALDYYKVYGVGCIPSTSVCRYSTFIYETSGKIISMK